MAKSITSLMIGTAVRSKHIRSVDDPVVRYVPELAGTFYDGVTLRHCLQMTSGVPYSEDYLDRSSDVARLQACTVQGRKGGFLAFLKDLGSRRDRQGNAPGSVFNYCSANSVLNGLVLERATGQIAPVHLERELWSRVGMESDAFWNLEAEGGSAFTASGFGATLRDYGRLALFVLEGGALPDGTSMLPDGWMRESLIPSRASIDAGRPYGFQWWLHEHRGRVSCRTRSEQGQPGCAEAAASSMRWEMRVRSSWSTRPRRRLSSSGRSGQRLQNSRSDVTRTKSSLLRCSTH